MTFSVSKIIPSVAALNSHLICSRTLWVRMQTARREERIWSLGWEWAGLGSSECVFTHMFAGWCRPLAGTPFGPTNQRTHVRTLHVTWDSSEHGGLRTVGLKKRVSLRTCRTPPYLSSPHTGGHAVSTASGCERTCHKYYPVQFLNWERSDKEIVAVFFF